MISMTHYFSIKELVIMHLFLSNLDLTMSSLMGLERYQHLRAASLYE